MIVKEGLRRRSEIQGSSSLQKCLHNAVQLISFYRLDLRPGLVGNHVVTTEKE